MSAETRPVITSLARTTWNSEPVYESKPEVISQASTIPELISYLKAAFRERDFSLVEKILMGREKQLRTEIQNLKRDFDLAEKAHALVELDKLNMEDQLNIFQRKCEVLTKEKAEAEEKVKAYEEKIKELDDRMSVMEEEMAKKRDEDVSVIQKMAEDWEVAKEEVVEQGSGNTDFVSAKTNMDNCPDAQALHPMPSACGSARVNSNLSNLGKKRCRSEEAGISSYKMDPATEENVQQYAEQVAAEEYDDAAIFSSRRCSERYDKQLSKSMIRERGIQLVDLEDRWPEFHGRLLTSGWICFAEEPRPVNYEVVREFYANVVETDFNNELVATVRGCEVRFSPERINDHYNLANVDNQEYRDKAQELGNQWFVTHLHNGHVPKWMKNHTRIESSEFTAEAKTWLSIICARIMPSKNETEVTAEKAKVICAILEGLPVNVGRLIVDEIAEVAAERTKSLFFPSLITHLCYEAGVQPKPTEKEKQPEKFIHPLLRSRAGAAPKKRRIDVASPNFGQFTETEIQDAPPDASSTPTAPLEEGPPTLRYISRQVYGMDTQVRQLVAGLTFGPSGESTSAGPSGSGKLPTLAGLAKEQQNIKATLEKIERRQKKHREHEKKKSKFLNKIMSTLRKFCGPDENEDDDFELEPPSSSSGE